MLTPRAEYISNIIYTYIYPAVIFKHIGSKDKRVQVAMVDGPRTEWVKDLHSQVLQCYPVILCYTIIQYYSNRTAGSTTLNSQHPNATHMKYSTSRETKTPYRTVRGVTFRPFFPGSIEPLGRAAT